MPYDEYDIDNHCAVHGHEPLPADWHHVCPECGHCFVTAAELVEEDRKIRAHCDGKDVADVAPMPVEDIYICPLCTHDF